MSNIIDITGRRFGRLYILGQNGRDNQNVILWKCRCDCGNEITTRGSALRASISKSCGCFHRDRLTTHGESETTAKKATVEHQTWNRMLGRCYNPNYTGYQYYGGRGIKVCERWRKYEKFLADMGRRPEGMSLDRYPDNNGNYEPRNCRWATPKQQSANRRNSRR